jgi:hypothetical protein
MIKTKEEYRQMGKSSKRKGSRGETITTEIVEKFDFCDCFRQPGSGSGKNPKYKSDLYIRIKLADDLKFELKSENKFYSKMALFRIWDKLKKEILPVHIPVMTLKENSSDTLIALKLQDFLGILQDCKYKIDRAEKENTVIEENYNNKRSAREIEFSAKKILQEVRKL